MKVVVLTGASGGIGIKIAEKFALNEYFVVAQYNKDINSLNRLKESLQKKGLEGYLFPVQADFNKDGVKVLTDFLDKNFKHVNVLINNAGVDLYKLSTETKEDEFDKVFNVNMKTAFLLSNYCLKSMIERQQGKIINISSVFGIMGASMESVYSASKFALIGYTKSLAKEVALSGVNVNCVCPGVIDTKMNDIFSEEEKQDIKKDIPFNRFGKGEDVAETVYFLASEKADYITGQTITVDGGYTL